MPTQVCLSYPIARPAIAALCSVPPSGNGKSTIRVIRRLLVDAYRITVGFVFKRVTTDALICRQCLLLWWGTEGIDADLARYQGYFDRDSKVTLDVTDLSKKLPSRNLDDRGRAPFVNDLPPCLVVGATDDFIVDRVANAETAAYYGLDDDGTVYVDSPHDVMLGRNWRNGADVLKKWIEEKVVGGK